MHDMNERNIPKKDVFKQEPNAEKLKKQDTSSLPALDHRTKPYKLAKIVYIKDSTCFAAKDAKTHKSKEKTISNLFQKHETEIKKANFSENKKWFLSQNLVSVFCPITTKLYRGQFTNSPSMTKNYQSIRFFDLGTVQIVPDKCIFGLHRSLSPEVISPVIKYCRVAETCLNLNRKDFLKRLPVGRVVGLKMCWTKNVSDSNFAIGQDMPFWKGITKISGVEVFGVKENGGFGKLELERTYCDLDKMFNLVTLKHHKSEKNGLENKKSSKIKKPLKNP